MKEKLLKYGVSGRVYWSVHLRYKVVGTCYGVNTIVKHIAIMRNGIAVLC